MQNDAPQPDSVTVELVDAAGGRRRLGIGDFALIDGRLRLTSLSDYFDRDKLVHIRADGRRIVLTAGPDGLTDTRFSPDQLVRIYGTEVDRGAGAVRSTCSLFCFNGCTCCTACCGLRDRKLADPNDASAASAAPKSGTSMTGI